MFANVWDELRLTRSCFPEPSQIHLHGQVGPRCTTELVGHLVGFTVTLGGFKVDGEGEDRWNIQKRWAGLWGNSQEILVGSFRRDKTGKNKLRYPDFMTFWMLSEKKKNRCAADSGSSSYSVFRTAKQILPMQRQSRHFLPRITASVLQMGTVTVPQSPKPLPVHSYHLAAQGKPQSRPARQAVIVNLTSALCNHLRWIYRERLSVSEQKIV